MRRGLALLFLALLGCERREPPGAEREGPVLLEIAGDEGQGAASASGDEYDPTLGTLEDNLPFEPDGTKLASIAWRTWIYTDTGAKRTRLGYLRVGEVMDARGPVLKNEGCEGGWLRINPRGFVCLGKGATQDLNHPMVRQMSQRPLRGEGFPYLYAMSRERPPERYFRLPSKEQMKQIEGSDVHERAANFQARAAQAGLLTALDITEQLPSFLSEAPHQLEKPYGVAEHLRHLVHAGQASTDSGFALLDLFLWQGRAFGVSTEMDILALDRLEILPEPAPFGLALEEGQGLPVAFHVRGAIPLYKRLENGSFVQDGQQQEKRGFVLTGESAASGMVETEGGIWVARPSVRIIEPRDSFPSVATGRRKWIDVSIKHQVLVAYEGKRAVYATLISAGRGGLGKEGESNPDGNRTVRGTFMIHEKSISSTMDGDEDRADSFALSDVPFVQYFHRGFALHGAYWHNEFGKERSHGCINLAPRDSAWLFEWSDPQVPPGWHAVLNKKRGTVVYVHY